jgi:Flp pilus assembly protein TadD
MRFVFPILLLLSAPAHPAAPSAKAPPPKPAVVDQLFAKLAKTQSSEEAKPIEDQIMTLFEQSNSATVDILMERSALMLKAGDKDRTKKMIYAITTIAPDYAEGWHRRAMLEAASNDDADAIVSFQKTITLNPREFEAQSELGKLLEDYGDKKAALAAYRKALAFDPHMEGVEKHTQELARDVEGNKI